MVASRLLHLPVVCMEDVDLSVNTRQIPAKRSMFNSELKVVSQCINQCSSKCATFTLKAERGTYRRISLGELPMHSKHEQLGARFLSFEYLLTNHNSINVWINVFMSNCWTVEAFSLLLPGNKEMMYLHRASWLAEVTRNFELLF